MISYRPIGLLKDSYPLANFLPLEHFRLEVAWVPYTAGEASPLHIFVQNNKRLQSLDLRQVDFDNDGWAFFFEALWYECTDLKNAEFHDLSEGLIGTPFDGQACVTIKALDGTCASLGELQSCLTSLRTEHENVPHGRYYLYRDDSEYESSQILQRV